MGGEKVIVQCTVCTQCSFEKSLAKEQQVDLACLLRVQPASMHLYFTSLPSTSLAVPSSLLFCSPGK